MPLALRAILLVLLALLPVALVQLHQAREAREARRVALEAKALRLARLVAGEQERIFEGARHLLAAMAAEDSVRAAVPGEACNGYLRRLLETFPRYVAAQSIGLDGRTICAPRPELFQPDLSDRDYFREALRQDGFALGGYAVGRSTGVPSLHAAMPFRDATGTRAGVLMIALSIEWLNAGLARLPLPDNATLLVLDRDGVVVARAPDGSGRVGQPLPELRRDLLEAAAPGGGETVDIDGRRRVVGYVPLRVEPIGLSVAATLDAGGAEAEARQAAWRNLALIGASLALGIGLLLAAFRGAVTQPVGALLAAAARWREGDWSARAGRPGQSGEFGRLSAAFDDLAATVGDRERARERSDLRLRALIELSPQIVFLADADGALIWLNHHWERVTGMPRAAGLGAGWAAAIHPEDLPGLHAAWADVVARAAAGEPVEFERGFRLADGQGGWRWHLSKAAPARDAERVVSWTGIVADVDALKRAETQAAELAARLAATYATAPAGLALFDRGLRVLALNDAMAVLNNAPKAAHLGRRLSEAAPDVAPVLEPVLRRVLETGEAVDGHELTWPAPPGSGQGEATRLCACHPVLGAAGEVAGVSTSVIDITARRRAERAERLLAREVDHRARNALAVVRSLVRLSAAEAERDPTTLIDTLEGRIAAMARAHTLLSDARWSGGDLLRLAREELAAHGSAASVEGPAVTLAAEAVQPMAMALHELVTNASKHGALSRPGGRVELRWQAGEAGGLLLRWVERGGPPLQGPPPRQGFGLRLVEANLEGQLDGKAQWEWAADGLCCTLAIGPAALARPVGATGPASASPMAPATPATPAMPAVGPAAGGATLAGARVLVVEDEALVALEVARTLQAAGCAIAGPAFSLEDGLRLVRAEGARLNAAVVDLNLRGQQSLPILDALREAGVPALIASGYGQAPEGHAGLPVLEKPIAAAALLAAVARAVAGARAAARARAAAK